MAKLRIFSAHDTKIGVFYPPFFNAHLGQALRNWEELCNSNETLMGKHPVDFVLYEIGIFDEDTGTITPHQTLQRVADALEVRRKPQDSLPFKSMN